ncbi:MAG: M56 family metallopeptidase [Bacteroidota bacterium]
MAIWIQSLSWALLCSLGQGFIIYLSLALLLRLVHGISSAARYRMAFASLFILLVWFAATWWQQYHLLSSAQHTVFLYLVPGGISNYFFAAAGSAGEHTLYRSVPSAISAIAPWLCTAYLAGLSMMLLRLSGGMLHMFSLRRNGLSNAGAAMDDLFASLTAQLHLSRPVQLFISAKAQVPMVVGFVKPIVLVPAAVLAQLTTDQLETILLHELAHIKRYDHLSNILRAIIEAILFFNPFAWLVSAVARREMEHCCDDLVLAHTNKPLSYARALAAIATCPAPASSLTLAASGRPNHLFNRIKRIMEMKKSTFSYSRMVAAIFIIAAITCSIAWLSPSFTKAKKARTAKAATTAPAAPTQYEAVPQVMAEEKPAPAKAPKAPAAPAPGESAPQPPETEESKLVSRLIGAGLVDQVKGFVVEKRQEKLYINGQLQADDIAGKYLPGLTKDAMRVQVFSFGERLMMHPDASFIQVLFPVQTSSGCVDYGAKKPGC